MKNKIMRMVGVGIALILGYASIGLAAGVNQNSQGVTINGYDTVAYFSKSRPVQGNSQYQTKWMGATWYFANAENKNLFLAKPNKYAPAYGGYCAYAVSQGSKAVANPSAWTIYKGRLFLNYNTAVRDQRWLPHKDELIYQADKNWKNIS